MKTPAFEYHSPETLDEALAILAEHGDEAKVLAGGQSLVPLLAMRLARPAHLVDVNGIVELTRLDDRQGAVVFGAMVTTRDAERSTTVKERLPLLADALPLVGHVAIRNRGTIGGSIAHADAAAEVPAAALASDAEVLVRSVRGDRTLTADELFVGHFTTAMEDDECLVEVRFPASPAGAGWAFEEVARRHGDFALAGAAAMVSLDDSGTIDEARVSLMAVDARAMRAPEVEAALVGGRPSPDTFAAAAAEAVDDLDPPSDLHGSGAFRKQLARVSVRRALTRAAERAGGAA